MIEPSRVTWAQNHRRGRLSAVFPPGHTLRCPRTKRLSNGTEVTCSGGLGQAPPGSDCCVVRCIQGLAAIPNAEMQIRTCESCKQQAEIYIVMRQQLEATG
jgi:hypothetical protein